jgi:hypothetical protein
MPFSKWPTRGTRQQAMNKKEKACDKDYITFCMKANNNFRAEFNMATYELFKDKLFTTIDSMSNEKFKLPFSKWPTRGTRQQL